MLLIQQAIVHIDQMHHGPLCSLVVYESFICSLTNIALPIKITLPTRVNGFTFRRKTVHHNLTLNIYLVETANNK